MTKPIERLPQSAPAATVSKITRRGILVTTAAAAGLVPAAAQAITSTDDAALLAAEAEITRLLDASAAVSDDLEGAAHDAATDAFYKPAFALDRYIATTPALTLAGAAVKLRRLLDAEVGIDAGKAEGDLTSLRHVLALIEASTGRPAAATRPLATEDDEEDEGDVA